MKMLREIRWVLPLSLLLAAPLHAQQAKPAPTLDEVLKRVSENFHSYLQSVPNLFAEEQIVTNVTLHENVSTTVMGAPISNTTTNTSSHGTAVDGLFFLRHGKENGLLVESRDIKSIDHKPVKEDTKPHTPVMEENIFSYAPSFVSPALTQCYDYNLVAGQRLQKQPVLVIEYKLQKLAPRAGCPVHEPHFGRAFIDPATMQILRLEQRRTEHPLEALVKESQLSSVIEDKDTGTWNWAIDYAPAELNGKTFWLPKTISSNTVTNHGPEVKWTFVANYRNYHLLQVESKLLPGYTVQK